MQAAHANPPEQDRAHFILQKFACRTLRDGSTGWQGRLEELELNRKMKEVKFTPKCGMTRQTRTDQSPLVDLYLPSVQQHVGSRLGGVNNDSATRRFHNFVLGASTAQALDFQPRHRCHTWTFNSRDRQSGRLPQTNASGEKHASCCVGEM